MTDIEGKVKAAVATVKSIPEQRLYEKRLPFMIENNRDGLEEAIKRRLLGYRYDGEEGWFYCLADAP
jgi:hypothetical protein